MNGSKPVKKKNIIMLPEQAMLSGYCGELFGKYVEKSGIFNVR